MIYKLFVILASLNWIFETPPTEDKSHWRVVKKFIQNDVEVVKEDESNLLLYHTVNLDTLQIGLHPCDECDITGMIEQKRGGNPYRVWIAHKKFWNNPNRPQSMWGNYFRASFLRQLHPPQDH